MVRIAAQTTVLNIYQVRDSRSREYALKPAVLDSLFSQITSLSRDKFAFILTIVNEHSLLMRAIDAGNRGLDPTDSAVLLQMDRNNHWAYNSSGADAGAGSNASSNFSSCSSNATAATSSSSRSGYKPRKAKKMTPGRLAKAMSNLDILEESTKEADDESLSLHDTDSLPAGDGDKDGDGDGDASVTGMDRDSEGSAMSHSSTGANTSHTSALSADTNSTLDTTDTNETVINGAHADKSSASAATPAMPHLEGMAYISANKGANRARLKKMENALCDAVSAADDWLYFLQDLLGLHIFHLRFGLVSSLLENWLMPHILPLLTAPDRVLSLEHDRDAATEGRLLEVKRGMLFLTQILKIVQDRLMQRAILVALLHPDSASDRAALIAQHVVEEQRQQVQVQDQSQDSHVTLTGAAIGERTNLHRQAVEQLLKCALQPASSTVFDLTSDHLTMSVSLLLNRVYENAISTGRYRELQSGEKGVYFAGLRYEMSLLSHLQLVMHAGEAEDSLKTNGDVGETAGLLSVGQPPENTVAEQIEEKNATAPPSLGEESEKARIEREKWEEIERKRRLNNAKHSFQYGTAEITEGELDIYLDGYGGRYSDGKSLTGATDTPTHGRTPVMSPVNSKSDLRDGSSSSVSVTDAGGSALGTRNDAHARSVGYSTTDHSAALLSLRTLSHINHTPFKLSAAAGAGAGAGAGAVAKGKETVEAKSDEEEPQAETVTETGADRANRSSSSLIHDLVDQLKLLARGPPMLTAPENSLGARNLSLTTVQALSQTIYSYCRFLHLTQTQLQDALEVEQSNFIPLPTFSFAKKDSSSGAGAGTARAADREEGLPKNANPTNDEREKKGEANDADDDDAQPAAPFDAAHTAALQAHLQAILPHIVTELVTCGASIRNAYQTSAQVLLTEIGLTAPETPNANDKVGVDTDLARIARESIADKLVQFLSEELERIRGSSWSRVTVKVTSAAALYLDSTPELTRRIGHDYQGWPILSGERARRRVQLFLLLRGLLSRVDAMIEYALQAATTLPQSPAPRPSPAQDNKKDTKLVKTNKLKKPRAGPDDLQFGLTEDADLATFAPLGDEPVTSDSTYAAGKLLPMKGRRFLEAKSTYIHAPPGEDGHEQKGSNSGSAHGTPKNGNGTSPGPTKSWSSNISTFFGFGDKGNSSGSGSNHSTPNKTPPSKDAGIFGFGRSNNNKQDAGGDGGNSASPVKRMFGSLTPTMQSAYGTVTSSVLFVQHQQLLVLVESTPRSIADDSYKILISVPLVNVEVFEVAPRKLRVVIRSYNAHKEHMERLGHPPPEPAGTQDKLLGRTSYSVAALRGIYADAPEDEDAFLGKSEVSILPTLLQARPVLHLWQTTLDFDNEKMCKLAASHVTGRVKTLRSAKHAAVRTLLAKAVGVTA